MNYCDYITATLIDTWTNVVSKPKPALQNNVKLLSTIFPAHFITRA